MAEGGFMYAIGAAGTTYVKIGSTKGPIDKRLKALHTIAAIPVEEALQPIERQIHTFLAEERLRGEWFDLAIDETQLADLIARAVQWLAEARAQAEAKARAREEAKARWQPRLPRRQTRGRPAGSGELGEDVRVTIRLPVELYGRLEAYAQGRSATRGTPMLARCIREAIEHYLVCPQKRQPRPQAEAELLVPQPPARRRKRQAAPAD